MRLRSILVIAAWLGGHALMAGDMSYEETTKMTGGSALGMMKFAGAFSKDARKAAKPIVTSVAVKGNRMARVSDESTELIDLDAETITRIDKAKREYSVLTFEQMRQAAERALEKAKTQKTQEKTPARDPQPTADSNTELNFEAHVRKTGATKQVSGIDTNEVILALTMNAKDKTNGQQGAMAITNDMWMASDLPGYSEVREFNQRFASKMGSVLASGPNMAALTSQLAAGEAMKGLAKEMQEVKGVPVMQVMRMGMTVDGQMLPAASEAPLPGGGGAGSSDSASGSSRMRDALGSSLGSALGGFGGFGRKKKAATQDAPAAQPASGQAGADSSSPGQAQTSAVLVESVTELGNFSRQVDSAVMQVPADYKLVPAPELKN